VDEGLQLDPGAQGSRQHPAEELPAGLDGALGPAVLLALEAVDVHRQLRRHVELVQVEEAPAGQLGAVREVEVLGDRVVLPAAGLGDGPAAPDAGGAVEVEEAAAAVAGGVLDQEMAVQEDGLEPGEQGVPPVDVAPSRLHHPQGLVGHQVGHGPAQEIGAGQEVGVEDGQQLTPGAGGARLQGAGLEAGALPAVQVVDVQAPAAVVGHPLGDDLRRLIVGVVQHLDLQAVPGVVQAADGIDEPPGHVHLVVQWQLDGDQGPPGGRRRQRRSPMAGAQVRGHQEDAVGAVRGEGSEGEVVQCQDSRFHGRGDRRHGPPPAGPGPDP